MTCIMCSNNKIRTHLPFQFPDSKFQQDEQASVVTCSSRSTNKKIKEIKTASKASLKDFAESSKLQSSNSFIYENI